MNLINEIHNLTTHFVNSVPKTARKNIGQFFTPPAVAEYMASLVSFDKEHIDILDAGAGTGILCSAVCERILENPVIKSVNICLYENNETVLPILKSNIEIMINTLTSRGIKASYTIKNSNFIWDNIPYWRGELGASADLYDIVISNPPYKKINKDDLESKYMPEVVYGQPNIYFLFMAMSAKLLKQDGQMVFINPRSFSSGAYFQRFRQWFFSNVKLTNLHVFISRDGVFNCDDILQETIILKAVKTVKSINYVHVTESKNMNDFNDLISFSVPYKTILNTDDENCFMLIPTNEDDIETIDYFNYWNHSLVSLGYKLKTGPVVDFRATEYLKISSDNNTVPLFWAYNFESNKIRFPINDEKKPQYIIDSMESKYLLLENKNYLFLKRFTSKEEKRRLQCCIYHSSEFTRYPLIGIENHLNYVTKINGEMAETELYGLYVLFNSTIYDKYYRILNGSTQVNANEINSMPFPAKHSIIELGEMILKENDLSIETCDKILGTKLIKEQLLKVI